ncbi:MAG: M20/M25/M40 family metallo-hydrolase [Pirellulaceae bacterium]
MNRAVQSHVIVDARPSHTIQLEDTPYAKTEFKARDWLVMRLMAVPRESCEESLIAATVVDTCGAVACPIRRSASIRAHRRTPQAGEVGNLIVKIPGSAKRPRIMLSAHMDTVPICVGCVPKKSGQTIRSANPKTGLGADDRAGVAAVLIAAMETLEQQPDPEARPPLTLCFFVQEEIGLQGSRHLTVSKLGKPQLAFNFDGGDPAKMTIGATGGERMAIRLTGLPAHAGLAHKQERAPSQPLPAGNREPTQGPLARRKEGRSAGDKQYWCHSRWFGDQRCRRPHRSHR